MSAVTIYVVVTSDDLMGKYKTQALQDIVTEADRLHRVIENLLLLVRVEAGQQLAHGALRRRGGRSWKDATRWDGLSE